MINKALKRYFGTFQPVQLGRKNILNPVLQSYEQFWFDIKSDKEIQQYHIEKLQEFDLNSQNLQLIEQYYFNTGWNRKKSTLQINTILNEQIKLVRKGYSSDLLSINYVTKYCNELKELASIIQMHHYVAQRIIELLYAILDKQKSIDDFRSLIVIALEKVLENTDQFNENAICQLYFMLSKLNITNFNLKLYLRMCYSFTFEISKRLNVFTQDNLKSIYYSMGKHGFYDEKLENHLRDQLSCQKITNQQEFIKAINLFLCAANLFSEEKHIFRPLINQIVSVLDIHKDTSSGYIANFYQCLMRCEIFDQDVWQKFIDAPNTIIQSSNLASLNYNLIQLKHTLPEYLQQFITQQLEPFEQNSEREALKVRKINNHYHFLELLIGQDMKFLNLNFLTNQIIGGTEVDFYFPKKKMIIEIEGPIHYNFKIINYMEKNDLKNLEADQYIVKLNERKVLLKVSESLVSKFKNKKLAELGYTVKQIHLFELRENNIQTLFLNMLV